VRFSHTALLATVVAIVVAAAASADDEPSGTKARVARALVEDPDLSALFEEGPERSAIDRGLAYLAEQQRFTKDGSFPAGEAHVPVGVTALCALALMADGNSPNRGAYRLELAKALDYLISKRKPADHEHAGFIADVSDNKSRTHGHGLATLALAQAYSMSPGSARGKRMAAALQAAVERIEVSQGIDGGWEYSPTRSADHEGSVTVCLVQGLRAAHNVGIYVDTKVIARAIEYVKKLQNDSGGFRYASFGSNQKVSVAMTGACLSTLHATGIYDGTQVDDGYDYIWRKLMARDMERERAGLGEEPLFPFYERFYLSQALWQHPDESVFETWAASERRTILLSQDADGSWPDRHFTGHGWIEGRYGKAYATAMNCLFLSLPAGLLPIFQR
jgi:hypothetical protein